MSTAIVNYQDASLNDRREYAVTLAGAGDLLPRALREGNGKANAAKVLLVLETGAMLGLHPVAALQGVNVIEGRPALSAQLMAAVIRNHGHKLRVKIEGSVEAGDIAATATLVRADDPDEVFSATWTVHRALRAGLVDSYAPDDRGVWRVRARSQSNKPLPWEQFTEAMLKARALSEAARDGASDVLLGAYTTEELSSGGIPTVNEPTEDWLAVIRDAETVEEIDAIGDRLKEKGEATEQIRAAWLARKGVLVRGQDGPAEPADETVDAELVGDEPAGDPAAPSEAELQEWQLLEGAEATP